MSSSVLLSGPMKSPFPQTSGFPLPVTCFSIGENLDRLLLQQPSFHEDQSVQVLPPPVATKFPPPCTDELRLPRCLSPLKPSPCESPSGNALPWLKGSACTLQLPLNNIAARDDARQSGDRESERIKMRKTDEHDDVEDAPPPKKRKGRCPNSQKEPKVPALDLISSRGRNAAKSLHSVFLYCPAVPMKEREKTNSSLSPGSATLVTAPRGAKSRGAPNLGTENARIKTRGFVKTCEQNSSSTVTDRCCVLIPLISRAVMVPKQDPPPKRGRGRPRKIKLEKETTDAAGAEIRVQKEARGKASEKQTTTEERKTCRRLISTVGNRDTEKQRKSDKCPGKTETDNVGSSQTLKPSLMKTLKELRKCIKWKPSKTRKGKEAPGGKGSKAVDLEKAKVREAEDGFNMRAEMEKDREAKFQHQTLYDNNHNLLPNTSKDECKPAGPDGLETWRSTATLPGNRDQSARSSHQGDYGSSTLSCFDEEENEDDEVDVLLYSPEKGSPTTEVEERVVVLPDEDEEEEDVIEIDVTGDEE
ncbi:uncharacterized protein LOC119786964 [Cyprinodon tularosa]|uniref:uncharacterized protein LOC119786964 n=1 Tax=Cyprinodon tularosa TaxID=77115 RepID=UPI0018E2654B|nr:uncharacterized protein LOC119786964 [Cyprinodon tularosa]